MINFKLAAYSIFIFGFAQIPAIHTSNLPPEKQTYVIKVAGSCSIMGSKLVLHPPKAPKSFVPFACTYEQDKMFAGYPNRERIEILSQLLEYEGDTSICSKIVCRYGYTDNKPPSTVSYPIEVDALYLLTTLSVGGYATQYCPYPVLIDTLTGQEIDNSPQDVAKVYAIYRNWFRESKKNGFAKFNVPLRNSRYAWYGTRKTRSYMLEDKFKISGLGGAFSVVGLCL
jgi:hypothetical protein